jgi:capsular exopolysaccharide synthesis family protein
MIITDRQVKQIIRNLLTIDEQANDGIAIVDLSGTLRYINPLWAEMHGYNATDELVGKHISIFHTKEQMEAAVLPLMEEAKRRDQSAEPIEHVRSDGVPFATRTKIIPVRNGHGNVIAFVVFAVDIAQNNPSNHNFTDQNIEPITVADDEPQQDEVQQQITEQMANSDSQARETIADIEAEHKEQIANVKAEARANANAELKVRCRPTIKTEISASSKQPQSEQSLLDVSYEGKPRETSLRDILYVFFRHKWKMVSFFFAVILVVTTVTFVCGKVYRSEAKLLMRLGHESVTLDPTAATGQIVPVLQSRENEINSELEILKSRELVEKVVDSVGPQKLLKRSGDKHLVGDSVLLITVNRLKNLVKQFDVVEPLSDHDRAILEVTKNLNIENLKNSSIISISYDAESPKIAQEVVGKLIDLHLEKHIEVHRTLGSQQFFAEQVNHLQDKLIRSENELRALKNEIGVSSVSEQQRVILARIGTLKQEIDQADAALASSVAAVKESQSILEAPATVMQVIRGISRAYEQLQSALLTEQAVIPSLRAKINEQKKQLADAQAELKTLNDAEVLITLLTREANIQETNYRKYSDNLEQARINYAMDNERISNISVVQVATFPIKAVRPNKPLNLALGLLLGTLGAIVLAIFSEHLDHSIKTPREAEERLQLPVLASIPRVRCFGRVFPKKVELKRQGKGKGKSAVEAPTKLETPAKIREYYEAFRERLLLNSNGSADTPYVLAVTGYRCNEGVSTVAANIAATISRYHKNEHVLLVDANIKHPSVHKGFKTKLCPGLTDVLLNGHNGADTIQSLSTKNVHILSAGALNGNFNEAFDSHKFTEMLNSMKKRYHFVVIDIPPLNEASSAARLASLCDGTVLVVAAERLRREVMQRAKAQLVESNANILGIVLNKRRFHVPGWLYRRL